MLAGPQHAAVLAALSVPTHPAARWRAGFLADDVHVDDVGAPMTEPVATSDGRLRLELFEGPLDLLLYLIRKSEIDIHDIPIVDITVQYHAMLQQLRQALEQKSDVIKPVASAKTHSAATVRAASWVPLGTMA